MDTLESNLVLAAEARSAQAAFESHMKSFYSNPFASQLLAASSKVCTFAIELIDNSITFAYICTFVHTYMKVQKT